VGSQVATLFFVRVAGPVTEEAIIRDFYSASAFSGSADQTFILSVDNTGNVHIQPQGEIVIKNMWGKIRGKIEINKESNFGNVLPNSSRRFEFKWDGEENLFDIGRYTAEVAVVYGEEAKQSLFRRTHFWIIPWKPVSTILGSFILLILLIVWAIRRYIRQALDLERRIYGLPSIDHVTPSMRVMSAPLQKSMRDFRRVGEKKALGIGERPMGIGEYMWRYRFVFTSLLMFLLLGYLLFIYFSSVLTPTREFKAEIVQSDGK
jgi:hypothetical protein